MRRTTLALESQMFRQIKQEAARQGKSLKDYINELLLLALQKKNAKENLKNYILPTLNMGLPKVDPADREAIYDLMDKT